MHDLFIKKGLFKKAGAEDGPSFEQQFGIVANAIVADKFPQLDRAKLAFQLIEKDETNSNACGAAVYLLGSTVIFVPAFYKNGKLKTGDMMYVPEMQVFLPLSDPWLAWLRDRNRENSGTLKGLGSQDDLESLSSTDIEKLYDPISKSASLIWNAAAMDQVSDLYALGNVMLKKFAALTTESTAKASILDTALALGKQASEALLDDLVKQPEFLNATLHFYNGNQLDGFAKQASESFADAAPVAELILPLDKSAKLLTPQEQNALYRDGYFIKKTAAEGKEPEVIRNKQLSKMFTTVKGQGTCQLLLPNGELKDATVFIELGGAATAQSGISSGRSGGMTGNYHMQHWDEWGVGNPGCLDRIDAREYMAVESTNPARDGRDLLAVIGNKVFKLTGDTVCFGTTDSLTAEDLKSIGEPLSTYKGKQLPERARIFMPNGCTIEGHWEACPWSPEAEGWSMLSTIFTLGDDDNQISDLRSINEKTLGALVTLPKNSRVIVEKEGETNIVYAPVTMQTLPRALEAYCEKKYKKVKVYSDGREYTITGAGSDDKAEPMAAKNAAFTLVSDYGIAPGVAKVLLKEASNGASYSFPKASYYWIEKTAGIEDPDMPEANIGFSHKQETGPQTETLDMPTIVEDPAALSQAVQIASQQGIKEVFDVTVLKLLCRQSAVFEQITEDIPLLMQTLDSLCRKLFQFYWHTDKMEDKYGVIKLRALEDSIKSAIDSLSELTIFFKLRSVDSTGTASQDTGDLTGQML